MSQEKTFAGEITVSSRIVDQLSSGLYETPAACLKELVNNAYDADATIVEVLVKPDADRVIISDNGHGISQDDFVRHFSRISESYKREKGDKTKSGRKKIGKIGIGFIAANEMCDTMEILSTKKGSTDLLHIEVHFDRMRLDPALRRKKDGDLAKADYTGTIETAAAEAHFTHVILKRLREPAQRAFSSARNKQLSGPVRTLYGEGTAGVEEALADPTLSSWGEFDEYSQNMLRVALNVPVGYHSGWIPDSCRSKVGKFERSVAALDFSVLYDGTDLRKPIVLRPPKGKRAFVVPFAFEGDQVGAKGYFYVQHGGVRPHDLHGVLLRIREAAVGGYDASFLDFPPSEGAVIRNWISAEIWVDDRLEEALNIDRKTLRITDLAYVELQSAIHAALRKVISDGRQRLYVAGNRERAKEKTAKALRKVEEVARRLPPGERSRATAIMKAWSSVAADSDSQSKLLKKYSVAEIYDIVTEVGQQVLSRPQLSELLKALTDRLSR